jgi:hypothetical protein
MTTSEISGSPETGRANTSWLRRTVMGTAFAAAGLLTLGAVTTPAQAWWYGYGNYPHYAYYHYPHYYGWYHYHPGYWGWRAGWGWHRGWGGRHW